MTEIDKAAVDAAFLTPDGLLAEHKKEAAALAARAEVGDALAGAGEAAPVPTGAPAVHTDGSEAAEPPANLFARPDKLDEALQRGEADYTKQVMELESRGILVAGRLPLIVTIIIDNRSIDALLITPWGVMADAIRRDEKLRHALAALDAPNGLPIIQPDLRAGSLKRQVSMGGMKVSNTFELNGDYTGHIIPFDAECIKISDVDDERIAFKALAKKRLLGSGKLYTDDFLGCSFMDSGREVPCHTLEMNMFTAVLDARQHGLHVVAPENFVGAEQIAEIKLDQWTWLDGFNVENRHALSAHWHQLARVLNLDNYDPKHSDPNHGYRREARASKKGLEI